MSEDACFDMSVSELENRSRRGGAEERASVFSNLGRDLSGARTPEHAARIIVDAADKLFSWDACIFDLFSPDQSSALTILCMDTVNGSRREMKANQETKLGVMALKALREGPQLVLRNRGEGFPQQVRPFGDKTRPSSSLLYVPMRHDDKAVGMLSLQSYVEGVYDREDLKILQALADHCGAALARINAEQELVRLNLELERRVRDRTEQLEAINKELEGFCYSVSHDLRAPLRSIRGFTEVLCERYLDNLDARGQEFLRRVSHSAQHMDKLIEDLLSLSRVSRSEIQVQKVNLSPVSETILGELAKTEPQRKVEVKIAPNLEASGDARLLRLVMENLLRNAWKFTSKTEHAVIEVGRVGSPEEAFFVRDNGAGFDMTYASKLFGVFQRLHAASEFPGSGVGLATVKRVVNRHGGRAWATGEIDRGATFFFSLPNNGGPAL